MSRENPMLWIDSEYRHRNNTAFRDAYARYLMEMDQGNMSPDLVEYIDEYKTRRGISVDKPAPPVLWWRRAMRWMTWSG